MQKGRQWPYLLLIHGVACDSEFFRETSKLLAETFTVISYDRRGYSRSIAAEGENDFSVWAHAEDAAEIIRLEQKRKAEDGQCPVEAGLQSDGVVQPRAREKKIRLMNVAQVRAMEKQTRARVCL